MADCINDFLKFSDRHVYQQYEVFVNTFDYANAWKSKCFTGAVVEVSETSHSLRLKEIFRPGLDCLKKLVENDFKIQVLDDHVRESVQCLLKFLEEKDKHFECVAHCLPEKDGNEAIYTVLLAEHVFSPLIPGHRYSLDKNHFPINLKTCPGKCNVSVVSHLQSTGIGHHQVWHGYSDILLDDGISVAVVGDSMVNDVGDNLDDEDSDEPSHRKRAKMDTSIAADIVDEKSVGKKLLLDRTVEQTLAQAIVSAFLHQETNNLVPTLCTSLKSLMLYMYDCEHDVLLKSCVPLEIITDNKFNETNIIYIWMILNYEYFQDRPRSADFITFCRENQLLSGFVEQARDKIQIYRDELHRGVGYFPSNQNTKLNFSKPIPYP